ncbi:MAG: hypothetical protein A2W90_05780 [Bacteroidetes bacterium GWF2_42_66]|nr:MAG: hypothetical protein A2W92_01160 [Bacteroidetes bacterium GWA2_42_15]OFY03554.1 MAG: hypothetical protein A2W89_18505 [Bacteroidetes bacterium GWE2_42_39]OFY45919.1 MAG: hypothetical protein A2W90_05780 [Bacteroidetes bacterium GWF2_42_66]HBL75161.1 hypothetical protein [Prolixibacteraceae bacterium]HCR89712.1 hypothetical protein [Prolixibacteraceae bacterium]
MKKLSLKQRIYLEIRSRKGLKQKKRNKAFRRGRLRPHTDIGQKKLNYSRPRLNKPIERYQKPRQKTYRAPPNFSLLENTEGVLKFINNFKNVKSYEKLFDTLYLDMSDITNVDIGAISLLLSAQFDISFYDFNFIGKLPLDQKSHEFFHNSGYLNHMRKLNGESFAVNNNHDLILKLGREHTRNESVGKAILQAVYFLTGSRDNYPPAYSLIMEMAPNAIEHAYEENKHWMLGMHCDEENKIVSFTFTDNGTGIINTLNRKYPVELRDKILGKNVEVLQDAFNKKYGSRTNEINRNKGLPRIKKISEDGKINKLLLITDNVYLDFESNIGKLINNKFAGTFYYWEIDLKCLSNGK